MHRQNENTRKRRIPWIILLALLAVGPRTGLAEEGGSDTLRVVRTESFDGWKLDSAAAYTSYQNHANVIESLLRPGADGESVQPGLAKSWEHDPETATWTFTLREDARFSNGERVTAEDVVFSLGIWQEGANFGASYGNILEATAVDDRTVRFKMGSAYDNTFLPLMSATMSGVMPKDFSGMSEDEYYQDPIGAGAYKVESWTIGGETVLVANEHFYGYPERPEFDKVVTDIIADDVERSVLFEAGEIDIVEYVPITATSQYDRDALNVLDPGMVLHLSLNVGAPPFDDPEVRRAVARAIDYDAVIEGAFPEHGEPATGILPPNLRNWAAPSRSLFRSDLSKAKEMLSDSSAAGGASVELIYDAGLPEHSLAAQIVQSNLSRLGFDVRLTGLETGAFLDKAWTLDSDMVIWSYSAISPDVSDPMGWFMATEWLFTGQSQDRLFEVFERYMVAGDEKARTDAITGLQDHVIEQAHAIPLLEFPVIHALDTDLDGFESPPWGVHFYDTISRE